MKQTAAIVFDDPCLRCGKPIRADYLGLCMDCADATGISELSNPEDPTSTELEIISKYRRKAHVRTHRNHSGK
jgi:hypothetical protein